MLSLPRFEPPASPRRILTLSGPARHGPPLTGGAPRNQSPMPQDPRDSDMRRHRSNTDRNLLIGFFALAFIIGGALIWVFYGTGAAALGVICVAGGAVLAGIVMGIMVGLQWLSDWLERREMGED